MVSENEILQAIVAFYVKSEDFNGIPITSIVKRFSLGDTALKEILIHLLSSTKISVNFDENPHILRFQALPIDEQVQQLDTGKLRTACVYPTPIVLKGLVKSAKYKGRPFTLRLALGEPQLKYCSFDLSVLEIYRSDPRYYYENDDISGSINLHDETGMLERDQVFLQSFGFSYDESFNRAVAVFLRYLADLSPEHQQIWNAKMLAGDYRLHPDYFRSSILGEFYEGISVFDAFAEELHIINDMCVLMGRPKLFRHEFREGQKPKEFCFLIRPTLREFNNFIHTLDKALSENLNREFFLNDVPFEKEETRRDGKISVIQKGTIQILDDWINWKFISHDRKPLVEMIITFREVRKLRQNPAHVVNDDIFDLNYFQHQRNLIKRAYEGVRTLRLIFTNHASVRGYEVPDWLQTGIIWTH